MNAPARILPARPGFPIHRSSMDAPSTDLRVRVVREAIEAVGMDDAISVDEHHAWMRVLSTASDASLLRLRGLLR